MTHPQYSPDLAPCDLALLLKIKPNIRGRRFDTLDDIQKTYGSTDIFEIKDFCCSFESWKKRWDRCVLSQRDYFQRDGDLV